MPMPSMEEDRIQEEGFGNREKRKLEPEDILTELAVINGNGQAQVFVLNTGN